MSLNPPPKLHIPIQSFPLLQKPTPSQQTEVNSTKKLGSEIIYPTKRSSSSDDAYIQFERTISEFSPEAAAQSLVGTSSAPFDFEFNPNRNLLPLKKVPLERAKETIQSATPPQQYLPSNFYEPDPEPKKAIQIKKGSAPSTFTADKINELAKSSNNLFLPGTVFRLDIDFNLSVVRSVTDKTDPNYESRELPYSIKVQKLGSMAYNPAARTQTVKQKKEV